MDTVPAVCLRRDGDELRVVLCVWAGQYCVHVYACVRACVSVSELRSIVCEPGWACAFRAIAFAQLS